MFAILKTSVTVSCECNILGQELQGHANNIRN